MRFRAQRQFGFTLLELIVVLAIMAGIAAVILPLATDMRARYVMRTNLREVSSVLRYARAEAMQSQSSKAVVFDTHEKTYKLEGDDETFTIEDVGIEVMTAASEITDGGRYAAIRFYHDGASTGGRVILTEDDDKQAVDVVWMTGQVRVLDAPK